MQEITPVRYIHPGGFVVFLCLLIGLLFVPSAQAATILVGAPGDGGCDDLADAINAANTDLSVGGCNAGAGSDTIVLASSAVYSLTVVDNGFWGPTGLPVIDSAIVIVGNGATIQRDPSLFSSNPCSGDGATRFRLFAVDSSGDLSLSNLTLQNACLQDPEGRVGGGAVLNLGILALDGVLVTNNEVIALANYTGGAAISVAGILTTTITDSQVMNNIANYPGYRGAIWVCPPDLPCDGASLSIHGTTISGNRAHTGAGITIDSGAAGDVQIFDSTLSNNIAGYAGGGILCGFASDACGSLQMTNTTCSGNHGGLVGGCLAVVSSNSGIRIASNTIWGNSASTGAGIYLQGSGIAVNLDHTIAQGCYPIASTDITSSGYNIDLDGSCLLASGSCESSPVPKSALDLSCQEEASLALEALADNGGNTETHALVLESTAVDAGNLSCNAADGITALQADQRGESRPVDADASGTSECDVGAYEYKPPQPDEPVPALSIWGLGVLVGLLGIIGWRRRAC
jgi:hypothetical protein